MDGTTASYNVSDSVQHIMDWMNSCHFISGSTEMSGSLNCGLGQHIWYSCHHIKQIFCHISYEVKQTFYTSLQLQLFYMKITLHLTYSIRVTLDMNYDKYKH